MYTTNVIIHGKKTILSEAQKLERRQKKEQCVGVWNSTMYISKKEFNALKYKSYTGFNQIYIFVSLLFIKPVLSFFCTWLSHIWYWKLLHGKCVIYAEFILLS